ncbi:hypothetical protein [Sphingopyxis flava]|uniref:Uncharacterized protein n=1 Tax=Sphingopyxis flava TaxID=1507287 RepID=A0A1T5BRK7_9SPHN|nr:hypothetical protein [Sphingopyxis flava]SKB49815.1 hypothetical protein SAMN06295937_100777 [Sphingopyxis flava]
MPLTPEEQRELEYLEGLYGPQTAEEKGAERADTFRKVASKPRQANPTRPFSTIRAIGGGIRIAAQGLFDTWMDQEVAKYSGSRLLETHTGNNIVGSALGNNFLGSTLVTALGVLRESTTDKPLPKYRPIVLPKFKGEDEAGWAENAVRSITSFAVPYVGFLKATSALRGASLLGRLGQNIAAGAAADFVQYDPLGGNMANVLRDGFGLDNAMLDSLASEEDDAAMLQRFKAAAAGAPLGVAGDLFFEAGGRLLKAYRGWKGTVDEAAAIVENAKRGPIVLDEPKALTVATREVTETGDTAAAGARRAADDGEIPVVEADEVLDPVEAELGFKSREFDDFDDVLDFLKSKAGQADLSDEALERLAKNLLEGDPENALARLGIDPLKIDFSKWDDAAVLGRLHKGLAEVYETLASRLGRSNIRVSELAIVRGAEALGSDPGVLKSLYRATENLPELLMGARLFVGAHSAKLLSTAQAALADLKAGRGTSEAWDAFLEAFSRHAYYMGSIRGAGSEVARALRSLQITPSAGRREAQRSLADAEASEAALQASEGSLFGDAAETFAETLVTDADKIAALTRLIELRGDAGELSRSVRQLMAGSGKRITEAYKETVGNLFTTATGVANTLSGVSFLALNGIGKAAAAVARLPSLAVGGRQAFQARRALYEAWAYNEALVSGWGTAFRQTWKLLQREGLSEAAINLDGLGLNKLAARAASKSADAASSMVEHFERADVVHTKRFALTTAETRALTKWAEENAGLKVFELGLKGLIRATSAAVNAAGSASRAGTTLLINAPDQLVGTVGAQAGAKARAVQLAAAEAAEMGLEGKQLGEYLKARTVQLYGDGPEHWGPEAALNGERHAMARAGETEARMVLFQDDLETDGFRAISGLVARSGGIVTSTILPFFRTPARIIERTAIDFTPLGLVKARIRKAIAAGGSQRDEALARMSLSAVLMVAAFNLADQEADGGRTIVGNDGGFRSTARDAKRPAYSIKIGDDAIEFNRLDPLGTLLGLAADLREFYDALEDAPQRDSVMSEALDAIFWSITRNILSKSWMASLDGLVDIATAKEAGEADDAWRRLAVNAAGRLVPAAGVQKSAEAIEDGTMREARTFVDGLLRASIGADTLPIKRDFLGRPIKQTETERLIGLKGGIQAWEGDDPLNAEMAKLSLSTAKPAWTQDGVTLNPTQYSRFLEIRGQETVDPATGLTMQQALEQLIQIDGYDELPRAAKIEAWREVIHGYTALAKGQMVDEFPELGREWLKTHIWAEAAKQGWQPEQRDRELAKLKAALGL